MEALLVLPTNEGISPHVLTFLDERFKTHEDLDLSRAQSFSIELKKDCGNLDKNLTFLHRNLSSLITEWVSRSSSVKSSLYQLNRKFRKFGVFPSSSDGMGKMGLQKIRKILGEELPLLAKEMRRIELVHNYADRSYLFQLAETTLRLEALVGDLEDAVLSVMNQNSVNVSAYLPKASSLRDSKWKHEKLVLAVKSMNDIEEILASIAKHQSKWSHLLQSVDTRVDKAFALLRMQSLADHRAILVSLGWPPPLLTAEPEAKKGSEMANPLVSMQGDKKERYCQSFLALCALQHLQTGRETRQQVDVVRNEKDQRLWVIDELLSPIASKLEHHFLNWTDEPKYMFALVYKITRDLVGVDDVLQPLIDKAGLVGYSSIEAWVSAMAEILSAHLTKRVFSVLAERYREKSEKPEVIFSWLQLVDLIIAFDKRMQSLVNLGTVDIVGESVGFEGFSKRISILSIFCDQPNWLRIWAKFELKDSLKKLKEEMQNQRAWLAHSQLGVNSEREPEGFMLSSREDHKAPVVVEAVVKIAQAMTQRCQTLPSILAQSQFVRLSAVKCLWHFLNVLLQKCKQTELRGEYVEDEDLIRVCGTINSARYCESVLREWSEDINFIEMRMAEGDVMMEMRHYLDDGCCFFWEEVKCLMKLETDWIADSAEIMAVLLRQFDSLSWQYVQNMENRVLEYKDYDENKVMGAQDLAISPELIEALDVLRNRLHILQAGLNLKDFLDLWRSVADGLDCFVFSSIITSGAKFSNQKVSQFVADMRALFLVFHTYCARPEAYFPCIRDSLKLYQMDSENVKHLLSVLTKVGKGTEQLRLHGILHISPNQAEKVLRSRS